MYIYTQFAYCLYICLYIVCIQSLDDSNLGNSDGNAIFENYNEFRHLLYCSKYFLISNGCYNIKNKNDIIKFKREPIRSGGSDTGLFTDALYYNMGQLNGITMKVSDINNNKIGMKSFVDTIINLLNKKCIICDALLILAFEYCTQLASKSGKIGIC